MQEGSKSREECKTELTRFLLHRINDYLYKEGAIPQAHYEVMRRRIYQYKPQK